jgi:hypothetical protein
VDLRSPIISLNCELISQRELRCSRCGSRARAEVREGSTKERGEHEGDRGRSFGIVGRTLAKWSPEIAGFNFVFRPASLTEGTRLVVIFHEFGHEIMIGTANQTKLPTKQIG